MNQIGGALLTLAVSLAGGSAAQISGLPLPWMLGPMLAVGVLAMAGWQPFGLTPGFPKWARPMAVPVIGVMIGAGVPPGVLGELVSWWPSLLAVIVFVVGLQLLNYTFYRKIGGYDRPTAFFAASPGGLIEAVLVGEERGGDTALMGLAHLGRVAVSVTLVPMIFLFLTGELVGSASGAAPPGPVAIAPWDVGLLVLSGVGGYYLGLWLRLPAAVVAGPLALSAVVHATGLTEATVPLILVRAAQLVIGASVGLRFAGRGRREVGFGLTLSLGAVGIGLLFAFAFAAGLNALGLGDIEALFLAFAPGGLVEMGLIALSLGASPLFVALHHMVRIMAAVFLAQQLFDRVINRR